MESKDEKQVQELGRQVIEEFDTTLNSVFSAALDKLQREQLVEGIDKLNDMAEGVLAVPKPVTEDVKRQTAEAIGRILNNQETAKEAFGAVPITIPYEKDTKKFNVHHVAMFLEHKAEMPYTQHSVSSGIYRAWIEQVPTESLRGWRDFHTRRLSEYFDRNWMPPEWHDIVRSRVCKLMYEIELVRRGNNWSIQKKEEMLESFASDLADLKQRYTEFLNKFMYEDGHPADDSDDPEKGLPY